MTTPTCISSTLKQSIANTFMQIISGIFSMGQNRDKYTGLMCKLAFSPYGAIECGKV